jgi:hypothetical protein
MAKSTPAAMTLFGIIQQIYVLFSASTNRWAIFRKHVTNLTVKPNCETRWESRVNSVKAVRYQVGDIYDALIEVSETTKEPKCRTEALSLAKFLKSYKFLVTLVIWYDLLKQINYVSKMMQQQDMQLDMSVQLYEQTLKFFEGYRESGFDGALVAAKELARELDMSADEMLIANADECAVRRKRVRKQFSYESDDQPVTDPTENFRVSFFLVLLDKALVSLNERFQQLRNFQKGFGFLFNIQSISNKSDTDLRSECQNLERLLTSQSDGTDCSNNDIDGAALFDELKILCNVLPDSVSSPLQVLRRLHDSHLNEVLPNVSVALRILLTIPVTVASGERSFSKLKLIKTYLRSTMAQDRLVGLAMLSIENDIASCLDYSEVVTKFAAIKARKVCL